MRTYPIGQIRIDGPGNHEPKVWEELEIISKNLVGKVVLTFIGYQFPKHHITVVPGVRACQSSAVAEKEEDAHPDAGRYYLGLDNMGVNPDDEKSDRRFWVSEAKGTGSGSNVRLEHSPGDYGTPTCFPARYSKRVPDEVLFHELVHGLREMQGRFQQIPTIKGYRDTDNEEEWLAILITDIYLSARGDPKLRGFNHLTWENLDDRFSTSAGFLTDDYYYTLLLYYAALDREFFGALAAVSATFNPVQELILNPRKYIGRKLSAINDTPGARQQVYVSYQNGPRLVEQPKPKPED